MTSFDQRTWLVPSAVIVGAALIVVQAVLVERRVDALETQMAVLATRLETSGLQRADVDVDGHDAPSATLDVGTAAAAAALAESAVVTTDPPTAYRDCTGTVPTHAVPQLLAGRGRDLQHCYEEAQRPTGRITLDLKLDGSGSVVDLHTNGTVGDGDFHECIREAVSGFSFGPISGGDCASMIVPLGFGEPSGGAP